MNLKIKRSVTSENWPSALNIRFSLQRNPCSRSLRCSKRFQWCYCLKFTLRDQGMGKGLLIINQRIKSTNQLGAGHWIGDKPVKGWCWSYEYMKKIYENHICEMGTQKKYPFRVPFKRSNRYKDCVIIFPRPNFVSLELRCPKGEVPL